MKERVIELYTAKYYGSNCCHFAELLEEHESLTLSASSVRRILLTSGLKQAKQRRRRRIGLRPLRCMLRLTMQQVRLSVPSFVRTNAGRPIPLSCSKG
ncbi:hypothetical protein [Paenibacillus sp. MER TA 81-3]|uniref:hypothetical protein n=1 Tax=Paenibacillus sp. MER TA 81-3 TaxID=2939573 RepID=UPI00203A7FAD|nr:hypothetical protein [Paenibacillus sp. MER TA 81-3]